MNLQRAHIVLPQELVKEIDALVGPRGRSAFLVNITQAELQRRRLLQFLQSDEPAWLDANHPEFADGTAAWVRSMRQESERRLPDVIPEDEAAV